MKNCGFLISNARIRRKGAQGVLFSLRNHLYPSFDEKALMTLFDGSSFKLAQAFSHLGV